MRDLPLPRADARGYMLLPHSRLKVAAAVFCLIAGPNGVEMGMLEDVPCVFDLLTRHSFVTGMQTCFGGIPSHVFPLLDFANSVVKYTTRYMEIIT